MPIRCFIDDFNDNRRESVSPSDMLVIDECMSAWDGAESFKCKFVLPHKTKIIRKPKGIGCEIKSLADVETKILLKLEIMEGKEAMSTKEFVERYGAQTAIVRRMVQHYLGTDRTILGDSAFASVKTAIVMREVGLHFIGVVKTAHKLFPSKFMKAFFDSKTNLRGSHVTLKTTVSSEILTPTEIFAVGWKDKQMKSLVCTRGLTLPGMPWMRYNYESNVNNGRKTIIKKECQVPRPQVVQVYFNGFSAIDIHDHYRQGSLAIESGWLTKTWWHRIYSTIFGMILTDAFFAYVYESNKNPSFDTGNLLGFQAFSEQVCWNLIFGHDEDLRTARPSRFPAAAAAAEEEVIFF